MYKSVELDVGGKLLRGCVRTPEGQGPFPTVCFYHGFSVDKVGLMRLHELFARECVKAGIACVRFDFYGCGESEGDFREMRVSDEIAQAEAIFRWTLRQDFADQENTFPVGHSLGGAISGMIAPVLQPRAAVLWSPGLTVYYDISGRVGAVPEQYQDFYDLEGFAISREFFEDVKNIDIIGRSRGYDGDVLIVHGSRDEKVPVAVCGPYRSLYGERMQLEIVSGANHQFSSLSWKQQVYDSTIAFLKKHITGKK